MKPLSDVAAAVVLLAWALQVSLYRRRWSVATACAGAGITAWLLYPLALNHNLLVLARRFADESFANTLAAIQVAEAGAAVWVTSALVRRQHRMGATPAVALPAAAWPGLGPVMALFYWLVHAFHYAAGIDFDLLGRSLALAAAVSAWGAAAGARVLWPEWDLRAELHVMLRLLSMALAVGISMGVSPRLAHDAPVAVDWSASAVFVALLMACAAGGWWGHRRGEDRTLSRGWRSARESPTPIVHA